MTGLLGHLVSDSVTRAGAIYAHGLAISGGNVNIEESEARMDGGQWGGGVTGTRESKQWHAAHHGLCSIGQRVLRGQG